MLKKVIKAIVADVPSDPNADWLHRPKAKGTISKRSIIRENLMGRESHLRKTIASFVLHFHRSADKRNR